MLLSNIEKQIVELNNDINESQNQYAKWKKPDKRVQLIWLHWDKILKNVNWSIVIGSRFVVVWGWGRGRDRLPEDDESVTLSLVMISFIYTHTIDMCQNSKDCML